MREILFTGNGDITYANALALLSDFLTEDDMCFIDHIFLRESENIRGALEDLNISFDTTDYHASQRWFDLDSSQKIMVILGGDKLDFIESYIDFNSYPFPVFDICRGMIQVRSAYSGVYIPGESQASPRVPLDGPESHVETRTDAVWSSYMFQPSKPSTAISEPHRTTEVFSQDDRELLKREILAEVMTMIQTHETNWHSPVPEQPVMSRRTEIIDEDNKIAYYKSPEGKLRRVNGARGTLRKRTNEELIYLTTEEHENLTGE